MRDKLIADDLKRRVEQVSSDLQKTRGFGVIERLLESDGLALSVIPWEDLTSRLTASEIEEWKERAYRIAIKQNPYALKLIPHPSEEICLMALKQSIKGICDTDYDDPLLILYHAKRLTHRLAFEVVKQDGMRVLNLPSSFCTARVLLEALKRCPEIVNFLAMERLLSLSIQEEVLWVLAKNKTQVLWREGLFSRLSKEFQTIALHSPHYHEELPLDQSFNRWNETIEHLMEKMMFQCLGGFEVQPKFVCYERGSYTQQSIAQTLTQEPMSLVLMENRYKNYRYCRYAIRCLNEGKNSQVNELKKYSPYHVLEMLSN